MAYTEEEARKAVVLAGQRLVKTGLTARTWGNISARISDSEFIITPSGRAYEELTEDDLVKVRIDDCSYEGDIKPSSEKGIHADCYRLRPSVNFVIHTHQFYASVVSVRGKNLRAFSANDGAQKKAENEGSAKLIPCAAYGLPSTKKLRKNVASCVEAYPECDAILMKSHGAVCLGASYEEAFEITDRLEKRCREIYFNHLSKTLPRVLSYKPEGDIITAVEGREDVLVSELRATLHPAIEDLAQIGGATIRCIPESAGKLKKRCALCGRSFYLVSGKGGVITGDDEEAAALILRKSCAAALYTGSLRGINPFDAELQRLIYVKKYSKIK